MDTFNQRLDGDLATITSDHGGFLRCEYCGHKQSVKSDYWRIGWPKHCGYTMRWWTDRQVRNGEVT